MSVNQETLGFQTEVKQLLHLMTHSLYSNKEIFLRELVSNASDALDKLKFLALSNDKLYEGDADLKIRLSYDTAAKTITISDNGIGMSRDEVIQNIGTIAKSGTKKFFETLSQDQAKSSNLIGQFGVGFYSCFIVADKVTLITRRAGDAAESATQWESDGAGEYTLSQTSKPSHGTDVILHLKESETSLLGSFALKDILSKYSDHISYPIVMPAEIDESDSQEPKTDAPQEETVNKASALWTRSKADIKEEDYKEFYKQVSHDFRDPLVWTHSKIEGTQDFTLLLYVPSEPPFDMMFQDSFKGIKLYVKRVFIMDDSDKLFPRYLRFIRGVIDSSDLPLNVSREILQESRVLSSIKTSAVKKVLSMLEDLAKNNPEDFKKFLKNFGTIFKEGMVEDPANKNRIAKILRFTSTHTDTEEKTITLDDYIARMRPEQNEIYYLIADNFAAAKNSALLELFRKKNLEVLLLSDKIDHWVMSHLQEFEGKKFQNITKDNLNLEAFVDQAEKEQTEKVATEYKSIAEKIQEELKEKVKDVKVSARLTNSPACLVFGQHDIDSQFQRILKQAGQEVPHSKPTLEINPNHFLVRKLKSEKGVKNFQDLCHILYDQAVLSDGGQLENPAGFVSRLNDFILTLSLQG